MFPVIARMQVLQSPRNEFFPLILMDPLLYCVVVSTRVGMSEAVVFVVVCLGESEGCVAHDSLPEIVQTVQSVGICGTGAV